MDGIKGSFDSFHVEEAYNWRNDIMEITSLIVHETDEARLNNIAEHFNVDLSEIREFLEMKHKKMEKPQTNADRIRAMSDEELAEYLDGVCHDLWQMFVADPQKMWLDWLKEEAE